jgi:hypothetical protein
MKDLISRVQRELPDTDKDRYDSAFERGQTQARSGLLFRGLAFGALVGAALMYLFDPNKGAGRRAELASRATGLRNRTRGAAIEAGFQNPDEGVPAHAATRSDDHATQASNGTSVMGLADDSAPGANVADPITPAEVERFGASGPVAGATVATEGSDEDWEAAERDAQRASEGRATG